jgi:hypothetical protein
MEHQKEGIPRESDLARDIAIDAATVAGAMLSRLALFEGPIGFDDLPQSLVAALHLLCVFASSRYLALLFLGSVRDGTSGKLARGLAAASMAGLLVMPYGMLLSLDRVPEWFGVPDGVALELLFACVAALWGLYSASPRLAPPLGALAEHVARGGKASGKRLSERMGEAFKESGQTPLFLSLALIAFMALAASFAAVGQEEQLLALALLGIIAALVIGPFLAARALENAGLRLEGRAWSVADGALIGAAGALWQGFVLYGLSQHVALMLLVSGIIPVRLLALFRRGQGALARLTGIVGIALLVASGL